MTRLRLQAIAVLRGGGWVPGCRAPGRRTRGWLLAGRRLPAGAVLTGLALLGTSVPAGAQTLTWSVMPSPSPGPDSLLGAVSCVSAAACTAVGYYTTRRGGAEKTLIETRKGTRWSVVPSPSRGFVSTLNAVSCTSAAACTTAGFYYYTRYDTRTLIESGTARG